MILMAHPVERDDESFQISDLNGYALRGYELYPHNGRYNIHVIHAEYHVVPMLTSRVPQITRSELT